MRIHRVYCKSLSGPNKKFKLDEPQSHHLIKALRIKQNDIVEVFDGIGGVAKCEVCLLYTSPSPRDGRISRMPSSA